MSVAPASLAVMLDLIDRADAGELSTQDLESLGALFARDPAARLAWVRLAVVRCHLRRTFAAERHGAYRNPAPPKKATLRRGVAIGVRFALAALIVLGFTLGVSTLLSLAPHPVSGPPEPVATLVDSTAAKWGPPPVGAMLPTGVGSQLPNGWINLKSGSATLAFISGAEVTLHGPAEFALNSPMRGYLKTGKLLAYCPRSSHGFTIGAPGVAVTDLGTMFGLSAGEPGGTQVHVLRGVVRLDLDSGHRLDKLTADHAAQIDPAGQMTMIPARPEEFDAGSAMRLTADALRRDPATVLHLSFENAEGTTAISNEALHGPDIHARLVGGSWAEGRTPGHRALRLDGVQDYLAINVPGNWQAMTIAMWVEIDRFENHLTDLIAGDYGNGGVQVHLTREGAVVLAYVTDAPKPIFLPGVIGRGDLGRWVHLVVTVDEREGWAAAYRDGVQVSKVRLSPTKSLRLGSARIGGWDPEQFPAGQDRNRTLLGCIDELTVLSRALNPQEVRAIYEGEQER